MSIPVLEVLEAFEGREVSKISNSDILSEITAIRFSKNGGQPFCEACGDTHPYFLTTRRKWKCRGCHKQFSVTSGTIFNSRKMELSQAVYGVVSYLKDGCNVSEISRRLDIQPRAASAFCEKIRLALIDEYHVNIQSIPDA